MSLLLSRARAGCEAGPCDEGEIVRHLAPESKRVVSPVRSLRRERSAGTVAGGIHHRVWTQSRFPFIAQLGLRASPRGLLPSAVAACGRRGHPVLTDGSAGWHPISREVLMWSLPAAATPRRRLGSDGGEV